MRSATPLPPVITIAAADDPVWQLTAGVGGGDGDGLRPPAAGDALWSAGRLGCTCDEGEEVGEGEGAVATVPLDVHAPNSITAPSANSRFMSVSKPNGRGTKKGTRIISELAFEPGVNGCHPRRRARHSDAVSHSEGAASDLRPAHDRLGSRRGPR